MNWELKESKPHGTKEYPYSECHINNVMQYFDIPIHWHDEFEILYILKGKLNISICQTDYDGIEGDIYLVNPKELHLMNATDPNVDYYAILFPIEFISFQSFDQIEKDYFEPLRSGHFLFKNKITNPYLKKELHNLLNELLILNKTKPFNYMLLTKINILNFFNKLFSTKDCEKEDMKVKSMSIHKDILSYINEHYKEPITLLEMASIFHMSEKYFSRYFKNNYHISFSNYITHQRIKHATNLLKTTDLSVTEVAMMSGFNNVSYFIRTFNKYLGCSPLKFRGM